jgi:hypothetical protein
MAAWDVTTSDPVEDMRATIEQWKNEVFKPEVHVVHPESYEWWKRFFEGDIDATP